MQSLNGILKPRWFRHSVAAEHLFFVLSSFSESSGVRKLKPRRLWIQVSIKIKLQSEKIWWVRSSTLESWSDYLSASISSEFIRASDFLWFYTCCHPAKS